MSTKVLSRVLVIKRRPNMGKKDVIGLQNSAQHIHWQHKCLYIYACMHVYVGTEWTTNKGHIVLLTSLKYFRLFMRFLHTSEMLCFEHICIFMFINCTK